MSIAIRRGVAAMLAVLAAAAIGLLLVPWHVVREHGIDAGLVGAALYVGPDYRVSPEDRADLLERGLDAGVTERVCRGIDHLGSPTLIASIVLLAIAILVIVTVGRRRHTFAAIAALLSAIAALGLAQYQGFLRHLLEDVGPDTAVVQLFQAAQALCVAVAVVSLVGALVRVERQFTFVVPTK